MAVSEFLDNNQLNGLKIKLIMKIIVYY